MAERQYRVASGEWRGKIPYTGFLWLLFLVTSHSPLAAALDDPTEPPPNYHATPAGAAPTDAASTATPAQRWRLTSTLISPQRRVAVVNGRAVKPGDILEGATVVEVAPASVRLRDTQGEFSVTMQPAAVKIPSGRKTTPAP